MINCNKKEASRLIKIGMVALFIVTLILLSLCSTGCTVGQDDAGNKIITFGVSEETHQSVQEGIDNATGVLGGLAALFPALAPFATAAGVGGLTWKRMKKTITKNKDPLKMLVAVLNDIKKNDAETWLKVKARIQKEHPSIDIKGTIEEVKLEIERQAELASA